VVGVESTPTKERMMKRGEIIQDSGRPESSGQSAVCVTRAREGTVLVGRETDLPKLIDHPRHGRTIIPIDPEAPGEEGEEPNTWRLDLGTIQVPE
jgi:hypothetical protein